MAHCGFDALVIDMEHGETNFGNLRALLMAAEAGRTPAVVRVPCANPSYIARVLDAGPAGICVPMVQSVEEAESVVAACTYPPKGTRGVAHPLVRASRYGLDADYLQEARERLLVLVQIETEAAAANAAAIASVDGVDGVFVGPLDLAASMGYAADPSAPEAVAVRTKVEQDVAAAGTALTGFCAPGDSVDAMVARGYSMVAADADLALLRTGALASLGR